jgi:hypothetical protein
MSTSSTTKKIKSLNLEKYDHPHQVEGLNINGQIPLQGNLTNLARRKLCIKLNNIKILFKRIG